MRIVIEYTILFLLGITSAIFYENNTSNVGDSSQVLSRRKRFIVFPEGSSFQLVIYTQNQGYLRVGDIVWFGNTVALSWGLPSDPKVLSMFKEHDEIDEAHRRNGNTKTIYFLDEDGKVINKMPYKKRPIVNPAFGKRSISDSKYFTKSLTVAKKELHLKHKNNNLLKTLDEERSTFHREGRVSFFAKFEKMLEGLGWGGRECLLRMLCETGRSRNEQGTFFQEIMRATLTLPKGRKFDTEYHNKYDKAHFSTEDCDKLYPQCEKL